MILSIALHASPSALACGGFACDGGPSGPPPILQEAEQIVFGIDTEGGEVEMHVKITYAGADDDFAWIVPVPKAPELFLTTAALFDQIQLATAPTFARNVRQEGNCRNGGKDKGSDTGSFGGYYFSDSAGSDAFDTSPFDVNVVAEELVGPYETVTLSASSAEDLLGYLQSQGYSLPDTFESVLAPYVSEGAFFVALKLSAGQVGGELAPLALRFDADRAMVPVQLTSISATPDMRMETYIFSNGRAVPESYLHVRINHAAIDWWNAGMNYLDVISQAANEAGGRAFATDYHGASSIVPALASGPFEEAPLRQAPDAVEWVNAIRRQLTTLPPELFPALEAALGLAPGDGVTFWSCPSCGAPPSPFDADAATDVVVERVFEPLTAAQALLDRFPLLSRMTSSMDAVEMTVDPVFVVNRDLADAVVTNAHSMTETMKCRGMFGQPADEAKRDIALEDGRVIEIPSQTWFREHGMTELEYLEEHASVNAAVIEQMGESGQPVVLVDHMPELLRLAGLTRSCGCSTQGAGVSAGLGLLLLGGIAARRRTATT